MTVAACGHQVDVWYTTANVICKPCFEAQGFVYNRNSYHGIDGERLVARVDVAPSAAERDRLRRARRAAA